MMAAVALFAFMSTLSSPEDYLIVVPAKTNLTGRINTGSKVLRMEDQIWLQEAFGERYVRMAAFGTVSRAATNMPAVPAVLRASTATVASRFFPWGMVGGIASVEKGMRSLSQTNDMALPRYVMGRNPGYSDATVIHRGATPASADDMKMLVLSNVVEKMAVETECMTNFLAESGRPLKLKELQDVFETMKEYRHLAFDQGVAWSNEVTGVSTYKTEETGADPDIFVVTNKSCTANQPWLEVEKRWDSSTRYRDGRIVHEYRTYDEHVTTCRDVGTRWEVPVEMALKNHESMDAGGAITAIDTYVISLFGRWKAKRTGVDEHFETNEYACIAMRMDTSAVGTTNVNGKVEYRITLDMARLLEAGRAAWGDEPDGGVRSLEEYGELDAEGDGEKSGYERWHVYTGWVLALGMATIENRTEIP